MLRLTVLIESGVNDDTLPETVLYVLCFREGWWLVSLSCGLGDRVLPSLVIVASSADSFIKKIEYMSYMRPCVHACVCVCVRVCVREKER